MDMHPCRLRRAGVALESVRSFVRRTCRGCSRTQRPAGADAVRIRGTASQRILRHAASSAAVMDAERESPSGSPVIEGSHIFAAN